MEKNDLWKLTNKFDKKENQLKYGINCLGSHQNGWHTCINDEKI